MTRLPWPASLSKSMSLPTRPRTSRRKRSTGSCRMRRSILAWRSCASPRTGCSRRGISTGFRWRPRRGRAVLKTVRMGYDGKGQIMIGAAAESPDAWAALGAKTAIAEGFVDYRCEISVVVIRKESGTIANYPPVENRHVNHILDTTIAPARLPPELAHRAETIARHIADKLGVIGVLAVEMFVTRDDRLLVNELAPRPHNSGHWTMDACHASQFEQLVRAICGLPLGSPEPHADAIMKNIIGPDVERWHELLSEPMAQLHL